MGVGLTIQSQHQKQMMKAKKGNSYCHESKSSDHGPQQRKSNRKRKGLEKDLNIGTRNVRTLLQPGKLEAITSELKRYKMDITRKSKKTRCMTSLIAALTMTRSLCWEI
ncbi:hypothetical protein ACFFRR_009891 [Megaselia abdita]